MMSQAGFLSALEQFPKDTINDEICELLQPYFDAEDYNQENAKRVCGIFIALEQDQYCVIQKEMIMSKLSAVFAYNFSITL